MLYSPQFILRNFATSSFKIPNDVNVLWTDMTVQTFAYCCAFLILASVNCENPGTSMHKHLLNTSDAPKLWFNYLRTFLHKRLNSTIIRHKNMEFCLSKMFSFSRVFRGRKERPAYFYTYYLHQPSIKSTIGNLIFKREICNYRHVCYTGVNFDTHTQLRVNLTFNLLHLPTGLVNCRREHLAIYDFNHNCSIFCGYYSVFSFYPKFRKFLIRLHVTASYGWGVMIRVLFMIFDQGLVQSGLVQLSKDFVPSLIYKFKGKHALYLYFIRVRKSHQIKLMTNKFQEEQYTIYDGPDTLTEILKSSKNIITTSTFQCTVEILGNGTEESFSNLLKYNSSPKSIAKHIITEYNSVLLFQKIYKENSNNSEVFLIQSNTHYEINITVMQLNVSKGYPTLCPFGGVAVEEQLSMNYKELLMLCTHQIRSVYSSNSSLLLTVYWYRGHSQTNVSLFFSEMKCKPVQIDSCVFDAYCPSNPTECQQYLKEVMINSNIKLSFQEKSLLKFDIKEGQCSVLLISNWQQVGFRDVIREDPWCTVILIPESGVSHVSDIRFLLHRKWNVDRFKCTEKYIEDVVTDSRVFRENKYDNNVNRTGPVTGNAKGKFLIELEADFSYQADNWLEVMVDYSKSEKLYLSKYFFEIPVHQEFRIDLKLNTVPNATMALMFKVYSLSIDKHLSLDFRFVHYNDIEAMNYFLKWNLGQGSLFNEDTCKYIITF